MSGRRDDPERVALVCRGRSLTYRELDERVSRMAHLLRARGIGPDDRVAVLLDRELELVVTLLAVMRAGGAYVPLDPDYPPQRLALMLEDSGARLVITQESRRARAPATRKCEVVTLEGLAAELRAQPDCACRRSSPGPGHLAYVIYTSGSTGRPKGVMVERGNVLNFFAAMDQRLGTDAGHVARRHERVVRHLGARALLDAGARLHGRAASRGALTAARGAGVRASVVQPVLLRQRRGGWRRPVPAAARRRALRRRARASRRCGRRSVTSMPSAASTRTRR